MSTHNHNIIKTYHASSQSLLVQCMNEILYPQFILIKSLEEPCNYYCGFSLTDNYHLRAITMIHHFTSRYQGQSYTLPSVLEASSLSGSTSLTYVII